MGVDGVSKTDSARRAENPAKAAKPSHCRAAIAGWSARKARKLGVVKMAVKASETAEANKPKRGRGGNSRIRAPRRRNPAAATRERERNGSQQYRNLLQRVAGTSVKEIDKLIAELQTLREMLQNEGARVQREIVEFATLSQGAMQSTRIIAESLTHWKKVPDAPSMRHE